MRVGQAQDERVFGCIIWLEGFPKAAEDCFVLVLVFLAQDYKSRGGETVLQTVLTALLFAGFGPGSALLPVAKIGLALSF